MPYVENAGFGRYSPDPAVIADTVCTWLASPDMLKSMQEAAVAASRPSATLDIAKDVASIVFEHKRQMQDEKELVRVR